MKITALTYVGNFGQSVKGFDILCNADAAALSPADFSFENAFSRYIGGSVLSKGVTAITTIEGGIHLEVDEFLFKAPFVVTGPDDLSFTKADIDEVKTEIADEFEAMEKYHVRYRLYTPNALGPRPLVLFLHGGGERGDDNWKQMVSTIGAAKIAERYPTAYVMAPQAPGKTLMPAPTEKLTPMESLTSRNDRNFQTPAAFSREDHTHEMLANVEYIIREMIGEGKVDPKRVYVTGMSMGGAGTLRAIAVSKDLYAACVSVCPFINDEIFYNLSHSTIPTWVSAAYLDHYFERNMYIAHGVIAAKRNGNKNMHLTIYSREELERYHIGSDPGTDMIQKINQNHNCWILTYNNEYGILDWMMNQVKE